MPLNPSLHNRVRRLEEAVLPSDAVAGVVLRPGLTVPEARAKVSRARARVVYIANIGRYPL